jgi:MFS superfamily sulfate permease-like transporter
VIDASSTPWLDYSGAEALAELDRAFADAGVTLHLAAVRGPVVDVLRRHPSGPTITGDRCHADVASCVAALGLDANSPLLGDRPPALSD